MSCTQRDFIKEVITWARKKAPRSMYSRLSYGFHIIIYFVHIYVESRLGIRVKTDSSNKDPGFYICTKTVCIYIKLTTCSHTL